MKHKLSLLHGVVVLSILSLGGCAQFRGAHPPTATIEAMPYDFDYTKEGSPAIKPYQVFHDGQYTYFQFTENQQPHQFMLPTANGKRPLEAKRYGQYIMVTGTPGLVEIQDANGQVAVVYRADRAKMVSNASVNTGANTQSIAGGQLSSSTPLMLVDPVPVRAAAADGVILTPKVQPGWQGAGNYVRGDQIAALQKNLAAMNANKSLDGNYAHAKATCTAKLAEWTHREVNTKGATEHLYQSALLLQDAAKRGAAISYATPPIAGVDRAYTDVWKIIDKLHAQPGARCAQVELACAAVNLQGAEYEAGEGYGKHQEHGRYFLGEVNKLLMASQKQIAACPPLTPPALPVVQQVTPKQVKYTTQAKVLFAFDSAVLSSDGRDAIKSLAADMANRFKKVESVQVVGYTDLLGSAEYNSVLSNKRARAVATELVSIPGFRGDIDAVGRGAQNQVKQCEVTLVRGKAPQSLKDCLEPNRRVEIIVNGEVK